MSQQTRVPRMMIYANRELLVGPPRRLVTDVNTCVLGQCVQWRCFVTVLGSDSCGVKHVTVAAELACMKKKVSAYGAVTLR